MPASAEYLTKYLTASGSRSGKSNPDYIDDSTRPKKRRKKDKDKTNPAAAATASSTLLIADDDGDLLLSSAQSRSAAPRDEDGEDEPMVYDTKVRSAEFRKSKSSAWKTLTDQDGAVTDDARRRRQNTTDEDGGEGDEADRILAQAAADSERRRQDIEAEDAPAVVDISGGDRGDGAGPRMSSGVRAGLQTAADTAALLEAEQERENTERMTVKSTKKTLSRRTNDEGEKDQTEETIYRDATGRRIDVSMRRAEIRAAEVEKQKREKKEKEDAMGEVQLRQREERKQELEEAKFLTLGRGADDEEMNEEMKDVVRWDDPMAAYMAQKRAEEETRTVSKSRSRRKEGSKEVEEDVVAVVRPRKKDYQGAAPPNRYGIQPGWRWDGVDRGNGFEKEWFQARGRKSRNADLEYQWQMDE